jgi:hypothetical protein
MKTSHPCLRQDRLCDHYVMVIAGTAVADADGYDNTMVVVSEPTPNRLDMAHP